MFFKKKVDYSSAEEKIKVILQNQKADLISYKLRWLELADKRRACEISVFTNKETTIYQSYYLGERIKDEIREAVGEMELFWVAVPASI